MNVCANTNEVEIYLRLDADGIDCMVRWSCLEWIISERMFTLLSMQQTKRAPVRSQAHITRRFGVICALPMTLLDVCSCDRRLTGSPLLLPQHSAGSNLRVGAHEMSIMRSTFRQLADRNKGSGKVPGPFAWRLTSQGGGVVSVGDQGANRCNASAAACV